MYARRTSLKTFANSPVKVFFFYKFQDSTVLDCVVSIPKFHGCNLETSIGRVLLGCIFSETKHLWQPN